jgi:hypothetical protein
MGVFNGPASAIEDNRNKVNEINEQSTKKQYPSALASYKLQQQTKGYVNDNFANAIKGTASGTEVCIKDVSPIEHNIGVKLSNADVKLYKGGKNLLPFPYNGQNNGQYVNYTFTDNGDGSITVKGQHINSPGNANFYLLSNGKLVLPKGSYTASGLAAGIYLQGVRTADGVTVNFTNGLTLTETTEFKALFVQILKTNTAAYDTVIKPMLEMGKTATEYELGVEPTECVVNTDGTANVPSLYPSTRLYTDTDGVTIEAEYNRDINKAFAELTNALISLGGNV